jgi:hypothetical protein
LQFIKGEDEIDSARAVKIVDRLACHLSAVLGGNLREPGKRESRKSQDCQAYRNCGRPENSDGANHVSLLM